MRKAAIVLAGALLAGVVFSADGQPVGPKDAKPGSPISAAGVLTDIKPDFVMLWVDGEDAPTKFGLAPGFDKNTFGFPPKCKGVFTPDRVQFTYTKGDDGNKVVAMNLTYNVARPPSGTVTGEVMFCDGGFWAAVKPKNGPMDGYAANFPPPADMVAKLKALQKGDWVRLKFHTDSERHRIDALEVLPKPVAPVVPATVVKPPPPPTTAPAAVPMATSQPAETLEKASQDKLKLVQMYLDSGLKDQAKDILGAIIKEYPNTEAAKTAKTKLAELGG